MGVKASTLRFWETEFPKLKPIKNKKGDRLYTDKDIEIIKEIQYLTKEKGIKISKASGKIKNPSSAEDSKSELVKALRTLKDKLIEIKKTL